MELGGNGGKLREIFDLLTFSTLKMNVKKLKDIYKDVNIQTDTHTGFCGSYFIKIVSYYTSFTTVELFSLNSTWENISHSSVQL